MGPFSAVFIDKNSNNQDSNEPAYSAYKKQTVKLTMTVRDSSHTVSVSSRYLNSSSR